MPRACRATTRCPFCGGMVFCDEREPFHISHAGQSLCTEAEFEGEESIIDHMW